jgi:hypothetical protein
MTCEENDCDRPVRCRGLCGRHYKLLLRARGPLPRPEPVTCAVASCDRRVSARGLCHGHYLRWSRSGDVREDLPLRRPQAEECSVPGCTRGVHSRGWCRAHYGRWLSSGDVRPDVPLRVVLGDGHLSHGYFKVAVPAHDRWLVHGASVALEHRYVMASVLGRPLRPDESVHHKNGDRTDNRPENLELWTRFQPNGARVADKLMWARELIARYEDVAKLLGVASAAGSGPSGESERPPSQ